MADILIIEDMAGVRHAISSMLKRAGHTVAVTENGAEGLAELRKRRFDLIVTDMLMPSVGGIELLEDIQSSHPALPVIIVTAFGDWDSYSRALALGAAAFISKPLRMSELTAAVHAALARRGATASP